MCAIIRTQRDDARRNRDRKTMKCRPLTAIAIGLQLSACTGGSVATAPPATPPARFTSDAAWAKPNSGACPPSTSETATTCAVCNPYEANNCEHLCEAQNGDACSILAFYTGARRGDVQKAAHLFKRACDLGSGMGCEGFARNLMRGEGVAKDETRAVDLLEQMCRAGRGRSCTLAGEAHIAGRGRSTDTVQGLRLIEQGCGYGNSEGCRLMADPHVLDDIDSAVKSARSKEIACERGETEACKSAEPPHRPLPQPH
jgi:hypothetical protein